MTYETRRSFRELRAELANGIQEEQIYSDRFKLHGPCQIDVPYKGILRILIEDVLTFFYIFQVAFSLQS